MLQYQYLRTGYFLSFSDSTNTGTGLHLVSLRVSYDSTARVDTASAARVIMTFHSRLDQLGLWQHALSWHPAITWLVRYKDMHPAVIWTTTAAASRELPTTPDISFPGSSYKHSDACL